ncbi:hypothetical protein [Desulfosporosinus lacus]|uniref:Uncharacterized protein n=1 Tax=Desulfosporosinus lacus DSM 15449 TaxID=1121420 RepID=A0A1M6GTK8_9FIRM|nr:hypothetical protein [Desulfosporosinus lacus]SHJ13212.1 hypothetical protein SAMN02746098_05217 [Desulfosporosinus lacus DSM 15449]
MNLEEKAKLIHELAKSPNRSSVVPQSVSTNSENEAITKVFSDVELSDELLEPEIKPDVYWA